MIQVVYEVDGSRSSEAAAREAIGDARRDGRVLRLQGVVCPSRFEAPQPAIGERIRRLQRVETQLLRLAREARAAGVAVSLLLPGQTPVEVGATHEPDRVALRPAAA